MAGVIGALAALAAIGFRLAIAGFQWLTFGSEGERLASHAAGLPDWWLITGPVVGGLGAAVMLKLWLPDGRGQGVPDVIAAVSIGGGRVSLRTGLLAALHSAWSLGTGASLGREGPVVHLGAALASAVGERLRVSPFSSRTFLGCGVAAAVAASFNAPLAGVLFALEVVIGDYALSSLAPVVLAAAIGTGLGRGVYGDFPAFELPALPAPPALEYPLFLVLGAACGLFTAAFIAASPPVNRLIARANQATGIPPWINPVGAGLVIGLMALAAPEILGVGYEAADTLLHGDVTAATALIWLGLKFAAVLLCLACGFGGGVFSPALVMGAALGSAFGSLAALLPGEASFVAVYAMAGSAAVAAATLGAPISTALIIFELTGNYPATTAAMLAIVAATAVSRGLTGHSFFTRVLAERGVPTGAMDRDDPAGAIVVADVMRPGVPPEESPSEGPTRGGTPVAVTDRLGHALDVFERERVPALPVVARDADGGGTVIVGALWEIDALRAHHRLTRGRLTRGAREPAPNREPRHAVKSRLP